VWIILGFLVFFIFSLIDYRLYAKYSKLVYAFNVIMLISVYAFGSTILGAKRWIKLGPISIQPSEFAKLFIVLTFAELLVTRYRDKFMGIKTIIFTGLHFIPIFLLIAKQPDLGTSLVLVFLYCLLIFLHGIDFKSFFLLMGSGLSFIPVAYFFLLKAYQRQRIKTFLNPEADMLGSGGNVKQSKIAIGSGGVFGKGFLNGTQNKLRFLPESHTDFIGSVLLEETGFVGGFILILLYFLLIANILMIAQKSDNEYGKLVAYGISGIIFFHTLVNLGMIMGVMPVTGLPLLLMSYGGSSFVFMFMMLGIVQSIKIYS
jgi:rod shape determining protein RodA